LERLVKNYPTVLKNARGLGFSDGEVCAGGFVVEPLGDDAGEALLLECEITLRHTLAETDEGWFVEDAIDERGDEGALVSELLEIGAIERRRVKLRDQSDHLKLLTTSITKLKSIEEIVRLESGSQCAELRCVILTDFIRKAEMPKSKDELAVCEDIGIVPIFEYLRRAALSDIRLGVLSGSLVIIPSSAEPPLRQAATALA